MKLTRLLLALTLASFVTVGFAQTLGRFGGRDMDFRIAATVSPGTPAYPVLPSLPSQIQENMLLELKIKAISEAYEIIAAKGVDGTPDRFIKRLEEEKAVWCLLSCLCVPTDNVQIQGLRSLRALGDKRAVPFLLIYAEYMAVPESGSESAMIHGLIHKEISRTLSALTGREFIVDGQDPITLKKGIKSWRKWLAENDIPDGSER